MEQLSKSLDSLVSQSIAMNNWPNDFPYSPSVEFKIAHNGNEIFIKFIVNESCTMAKVENDNGEVWTDSCVEFFITFDDSGYYNFEFTAIGKALLGFRKVKSEATHADERIMSIIRRISTLGTDCFDEIVGDNISWELTVAIPKEAFFKHNFATLDSLEAKSNLYKCGDNLSKPHFLSWSPIDTPSPNFHVPKFFVDIIF